MPVHKIGPITPILSVLLFVVFVLSGCSHNKYGGGTTEAEISDAASANVKAGVMTEPEYRRYALINGETINGEAPSAADLNWLVALGNRPGTPLQEGVRYTEVGTTLSLLPKSSATPALEDALLAFGQKIAHAEGDAAKDDCHYVACRIFFKFGKRGIPYLMALYNDPDPLTARQARALVRDINQKNAKKQAEG